MVPVTEQIADGYVALVKDLNWNRVAVISYDSELYHGVCPNKLHMLLCDVYRCSCTV